MGINFKILEPVLLTGAGFTHNFGGFLAKDMWAQIFNSQEVKRYPSLVHLLKDDLDYESVYFKVIYGDYEFDDQQALMKAVTRAYEKLDVVVRNFTSGSESPYPVNIYGVNRLIGNFAGEKGGNT